MIVEQQARFKVSEIKLTLRQEQELRDLRSNLSRINYLRPDHNPDRKWSVFYGETWLSARNKAFKAAVADGYFTRLDEGTKAVGSPLKAIKSDIVRNTIWGIARNMGYKAGLNFALSASEESKKYANWMPALDVASAISLMYGMTTVQDINFEDKKRHLSYVGETSYIMEKGYVPACDFKGVFYVYCKGRKPSSKDDDFTQWDLD